MPQAWQKTSVLHNRSIRKQQKSNQNWLKYIILQQFRSLQKNLMSSGNNIIERTFRFQNYYTGSISQFTTSLDINEIQNGKINISTILTQVIQKRTLPLFNSLIFFMDYQKKISHFKGTFLGNDILLQKQNVQHKTIEIRFKTAQMETISHPSISSIRKVKERSIKQAIMNVKKWLSIYNEKNQKGQRINTLQNAAKIIGMSKKTLSDYFKLIQGAQKHNFDFIAHEHDKVGILRNFLKAKVNQKKRKMSEETIIDPDLFWSLGFEDQNLQI